MTPPPDYPLVLDILIKTLEDEYADGEVNSTTQIDSLDLSIVYLSAVVFDVSSILERGGYTIKGDSIEWAALATNVKDVAGWARSMLNKVVKV